MCAAEARRRRYVGPVKVSVEVVLSVEVRWFSIEAAG
jgi:hypothetical protein